MSVHGRSEAGAAVSRTTDAAPLLQADGLTLRTGTRTLLQQLNLTVHAGELWCVLGPNGSGKSTLLHTLAGLRAPDGGRLLLHGRPLAQWPPAELARQRSLLPQHWHDAYGTTVLESVLMGRHPHLSRWGWEGADDCRRAHDALQAVRMDELAARDVATLSGGERQRAAIATLLVQDAAVMLLDEPVSHLDLHHQIVVLDHLRACVQRAASAAVVALHDLHLACRYATHVLVLGGAQQIAGPVDTAMDADALSAAFGHPVTRVQAAGRSWFVPA